MAKMIHTMIRVLSADKSIAFYDHVFGLKVSERCDFDGFSLVYLRNAECDIELELTENHGKETAYTHGDGYGHVAFVVDHLEDEHARIKGLGYEVDDIVEFNHEGKLLATFFFMKDPDGYSIELLQNHGRYK